MEAEKVELKEENPIELYLFRTRNLIKFSSSLILANIWLAVAWLGETQYVEIVGLVVSMFWIIFSTQYIKIM